MGEPEIVGLASRVRWFALRSVWIAVAVYAIVMTGLGIDRYVTYHSGEDLGVFVQAIADAAHGMRDQGELGSHFTHHFSPILFLCAPFLWALHSPVALIALQACVGALAAPAIFLIARRRMDERLARLAAIIALLYPPLIGVTFTDFHENGFVPAAAAWLIYALDGNNYRLAAVFALVMLAIKEDQAFVLGVLGLGFAFWSLRRGDRRGVIFGSALTFASVLVFGTFFGIILPWGGARGYFALQYFAAIHGEAHGLNVVFGRLSYLIEAFGPLLFLPLRSPWVLLAVPGFGEVLSSRWPIVYTMGQHYAAVWIGYVLVAFVMGLAAIGQHNPRRANALAIACVVVCILVNVVASPAHWGHYLGLRTRHDRALDATLARIPAGASAGSVDEIFVHMSLNPQAHTGYEGGLDYLVVDDRYDSQGWRDTYRPQWRRQMASGRYVSVWTDDGITLYSRLAPQREAKLHRAAHQGRRADSMNRTWFPECER
jgi:uncharacterized membrane protein